MLVAVPIFGASIALDSWYHGKFTLVAWNFLKFNILNEGSSQFGTEPFYFYLVKYFNG